MSDIVQQETKAQRVERLKREVNPWQAYDQIVRFAREGYASIPPEWLNTYFRWWGIYTQGDGVGAVGGKGGEGRATPYFMVRLRIPNGMLLSHQVRTIADLAERHARSVADITVRQNFQLHWVRVEALPDIFQSLWRCGRTAVGAGWHGRRHAPRSPPAAVGADEPVDAHPPAPAATW